MRKPTTILRFATRGQQQPDRIQKKDKRKRKLRTTKYERNEMAMKLITEESRTP